MDLEKNKKVWYNRFWLTKNFAWLLVSLYSCWLDIKCFFIFRRTMKRLAKDPRSKFRQMGLKLNSLGNVVYTHKIMNEDRVLYLNDRQKNAYLIDVTMGEHQYLFDELNWGEFLLTSFVEFADENDNPSGYYGVEFKFTPISLGNMRIYKFLLFYAILLGLPLWIFRHWIWLGIVKIWEFANIMPK